VTFDATTVCAVFRDNGGRFRPPPGRRWRLWFATTRRRRRDRPAPIPAQRAGAACQDRESHRGTIAIWRRRAGLRLPQYQASRAPITRLQPDGPGTRPLSVQARRLRTLTGGGRSAPERDLYQPPAARLSVFTSSLATTTALDEEGAALELRSSRLSSDAGVPRSLRRSRRMSRLGGYRWRIRQVKSRLQLSSGNGWRSERASHRSCTTPCCRAS